MRQIRHNGSVTIARMFTSAGRAYTLVALLLLPAAPLFGERLIIDPPTVGMDTEVLITVETDRGGFPNAIRIPMIGLETIGLPEKDTRVRTRPDGTFVAVESYRLLARPTEPGVAHVGPVSYVAADGGTVTLPEQTLTVAAPPTIDPTDAAKAFAAMEAAHLEPVFIRTVVAPEKLWAGQTFVITWYAVARQRPHRLDLEPTAPMPDLTVNEDPYIRSIASGYQSLPADAIQKEAEIWPLRRIYVMAKNAGVIPVPQLTATFRYLKVPRSDSEMPYRNRDVRRTSQPLSVDVALPAGDFDFVGDRRAELAAQITPGDSSSRELTFQDVNVSLTSFADLTDVRPPRFETPPEAKVTVSDLGTDKSDQSRWGVPASFRSTHRWLFKIEADKKQLTDLPPIVLRRFDPESGNVETMTARVPTGFYISPKIPPRVAVKPARRFTGLLLLTGAALAIGVILLLRKRLA